MKLVFRVRPPGKKPRRMTVKVPFHQLVLARVMRFSTRQGMKAVRLIDVSPEWIDAFEARHCAEVLEIRLPARRARE